MKAQDLPKLIVERWRANHGVLWLVGEEFFRYQTAIEEAAKAMREDPDKDRREQVIVQCQDNIAGFYEGAPGITKPTDDSHQPLTALKLAVGTEKLFQSLFPNGDAPFNPTKDIILIFKDMDHQIKENPQIGVFIRNIVQYNICSDNFAGENDKRGKRMMVFVTTTAGNMPKWIPELKPLTIDLPDLTTLTATVERSIEPLEKKKLIPKLAIEDRRKIIHSLNGFTDQAAEDAIALAIARHRGFGDMESVIQTIEEQKAVHIEGVQGLTYVSKEGLGDPHLPGYEKAIEFILECMCISDEVARQRKMQRLRGLALGGRPGVGKTRFAKLIAKLVDRVLLLWSLGETQSQWVGESEANARRAIQVAQAVEGVILVDDVDKAGVAGATDGSGGGNSSFSRIIQMLLTEMSSPNNRAIWIFTFNRAQNLPAELLRRGRVNECFFVQAPDTPTRKDILISQAKDRLFDLTGLSKKESEYFADLVDDPTDEWVGAELEDLVEQAGRRAIRLGNNKLDIEWMVQRAKETVCMAKQDVNKADIQQMEAACAQFARIGRRTGDEVKKQRTERAGRNISS